MDNDERGIRLIQSALMIEYYTKTITTLTWKERNPKERGQLNNGMGNNKGVGRGCTTMRVWRGDG